MTKGRVALPMKTVAGRNGRASNRRRFDGVVEFVVRFQERARPDEPSVVPKLHPLRAWPRILRGHCFFTYTYSAFSARRAAQAGMVRRPLRAGRGAGGRALCLQITAHAYLELRYLWRPLWIISHLLDCVLGNYLLPGHGRNRQIRNHQVVDGDPDQRCPSPSALDRLCLW